MNASGVRGLPGVHGRGALACAVRVATAPEARVVALGLCAHGQPLPYDAMAHERPIVQGPRVLCGFGVHPGGPSLPAQRRLRLDVAQSEGDGDERIRGDDSGSILSDREARDMTLAFRVEGYDRRQTWRAAQRLVMGPIRMGLLPQDAAVDGSLSPGGTLPPARHHGWGLHRRIGTRLRVWADARWGVRLPAGQCQRAQAVRGEEVR